MTIPSLENLSIEEKLQAMETLWDDLCRNAEAVTSPEWHRDVLARRADAVARGEESPEDWEEAKRRIQQERL